MVTWLILTEAALRFARTITLFVAVAAGSTFLTTGGASAAQEDAATGGGQILFGTEGGAGDTIAFTARGTADAATGQVQYVNRTDGTGQGQTVQHGTVTCIRAEGNVAFIEGVWRDGGEFGLYVQDNGEGSAAEDDIVAITPANPDDCGDEAEDDNMTALGRGNAQVRDNA